MQYHECYLFSEKWHTTQLPLTALKLSTDNFEKSHQADFRLRGFFIIIIIILSEYYFQESTFHMALVALYRLGKDPCWDLKAGYISPWCLNFLYFFLVFSFVTWVRGSTKLLKCPFLLWWCHQRLSRLEQRSYKKHWSCIHTGTKSQDISLCCIDFICFVSPMECKTKLPEFPLRINAFVQNMHQKWLVADL